LADDFTVLQRIDVFNRQYGHMIDDGELEGWPNLFAKDALYKITTRWNHDNNMPAGLMLCEGRAMMEDRISALRVANIYEPHCYRHLIDPPLITNISNHEIFVCTSFVVFRIMENGAAEIFTTGKYLDRLRDGDGELEFQERIVVCDSELIDTMVAIPL
jgi:3-phenylpropionate/cinnamic acid dioxygenase small subunit